MDIRILSSGRANKQTTWESLPMSMRDRVKIVVPKDEVATYQKQIFAPRVIGCPHVGIGATRQWVIEQSLFDGNGLVAMLDDDLVFATRRKDNPTKFENASEADIIGLFETIHAKLEYYAHVGVATREGGNRNTEPTMMNTRMLRILCYDAQVLKEHDIRFDRLPVMEDFDVTLNLLRRGYQNLVLNHMVQNQNGSNLKGGCSQYRTPETQALAAIILQKYHAPFVKVVTKKTKTAWGWGEREDVIIQWKKALNADI